MTLSEDPLSGDPFLLVPPGGHRSRAGWLLRCGRCAMHARLCLCADLERLPLDLRVVVICTVREAQRPTNTGRLVPLTLTGGERRVRGLADDPLRTDDLVDPGRRTLLLFPSPDAHELRLDPQDPRPVTLIVPDGSWRSARKLTTREPILAGLERVHLPPGPPSRYRLRSHADPRFLSTAEAVARALEILEGPAARAHLERAFTRFVERTLWSRGRLSADLVTGGIPCAGTVPRERAAGSPITRGPAMRTGANPPPFVAAPYRHCGRTPSASIPRSLPAEPQPAIPR